MNTKIKEVEDAVKERLKIEEIDRDATLSNYGLDSLDVVEFILDIEEKYGVSFETSEFKDLTTVGQLLDLIEKKL